MGITVYSLLWVMQDFYYQPYELKLLRECQRGHSSQHLARLSIPCLREKSLLSVLFASLVLLA